MKNNNESVDMNMTKYAHDIGQAYKRGITEGILAYKRGDEKFIKEHMIDEKLWDSLNIRK